MLKIPEVLKIEPWRSVVEMNMLYARPGGVTLKRALRKEVSVISSFELDFIKGICEKDLGCAGQRNYGRAMVWYRGIVYMIFLCFQRF